MITNSSQREDGAKDQLYPSFMYTKPVDVWRIVEGRRKTLLDKGGLCRRLKLGQATTFNKDSV